MRRALALLPFALVLAACGGGSAPSTTAPATTAATATAAPSTTAKRSLRVVLTAESHHPVVGHSWSYEVRVTDRGTRKPVACRIHLQFLFAGSPVGEIGVHDVKDGVWKETIPAKGSDAFPPAAVGQPLVVQATVTAKGYRLARARWPIVVKK